MHKIEQTQRRRSATWIAALITVTLMIAFGQTGTALGQWTQSGSNITTTNNVGIGTMGANGPTAPLEINKSQSGVATIILDNGNVAENNSAYTGVGFKQAGEYRFIIAAINDNNTGQVGGPGAVQFWNFKNGPMLFATGSTERMRVDATGNIGFGTKTPLTFQGGFVMSGKAFQFQSVNDHATLAISASGAGKVPVLTLENGDATATKRIVAFYYDGGSNLAKFRFQSEQAGGGVTLDNVLVLKNNGAVGINMVPTSTDPQVKLEVDGSINVTGNINAKYQDVAEWVSAAHLLPAGTVVVLNPAQSNQVLASTQAYDTRVAGVVSARPGLVLGEGGAGKVMVATTGRVKVKVDARRAPIHIGDLLVTSNEEGVAMKSEPLSLGGAQLHRPGTLIGKALESLETGTGEILVLLSLQ